MPDYSIDGFVCVFPVRRKLQFLNANLALQCHHIHTHAGIITHVAKVHWSPGTKSVSDRIHSYATCYLIMQNVVRNISFRKRYYCIGCNNLSSVISIIYI